MVRPSMAGLRGGRSVIASNVQRRQGALLRATSASVLVGALDPFREICAHRRD
jgi:hypothetical protein